MSLEIKKIELELKRVETARLELEFKILEREEEIQRLKDHVAIQSNRETELKEKLKEFK